MKGRKYTEEERWEMFTTTGFDALKPGIHRDELFALIPTHEPIDQNKDC